MVITIREVAKHLHLSPTTVSRALDGYADVADDTRKQIIQTAHDLGYVPHQAARQLRRKRSDTLGYILPADSPRFYDPFFSEFTAGLGDESAARGFDLLVSAAEPDSPAEKVAYERWVHGRKVDGIVLNRIRVHDWRIQYLAQQNFSFVCLQRSLDSYEYPSVEVNGQFWLTELMAHLVSLGHRRIAFIGVGNQLIISAERLAGYRDGLEKFSLPFDESLVLEGDLTSASGYLAGKKLLTLPDPPTAIACMNDMTAYGVLHAARDHGLVVGKDLAVAGFDGNEGFEHTQPPLTTINQPTYLIARRLVGILADVINGLFLEDYHVQIQPTLEIRQSTRGYG